MSKNIKEFILVLMLFVGVYILYFYPNFTHFNSALFFFDDQVDGYQVYWNTWHFSHKLSQFQNPFNTDYLLFPNNSSLWMHAYTAFYGIINLVVKNPYLAINLGIAINLILAALGFYYLSKKFLSNSVYAFSTAFMAIFNSYIIIKTGVHFNLILIVLMPWILVVFFNNIEWRGDKASFKDKRSIVKIGLLLMLNFLFDYYAIFYSLSLMILFFFYFNVFRPWMKVPSLKKYGIVAIVFVVGHFVARLMRIKGFNEKGALWGAADVRQMFFPRETSKYLSDIAMKSSDNMENFVFLGYGLMLFFLMALGLYIFKLNKDKWSSFLLFSMVVYFMVIFPNLRIGEHKLFYFFTGIIHYIPFVNQVRVSSRFIEMLFFLIPLFVFLNVQKLMNKLIQLVFPFLVLGVFYVNHAQINQTMSQSHFDKNSLLSESKEDIILTIPFGIRDGYHEFGHFNNEVYSMQVEFGFKNVSGYYSRVRDDIFEKARVNKFLIELVKAQENKAWKKLTSVEVEAFLKEYPISKIYMNKSYLKKHPMVHDFLDHCIDRDEFKWSMSENELQIKF